MAVVKDLECSRCGSVVEADVPMNDGAAILPCARCGLPTVHSVVCNGGVRGPRWRYVDVTADYIRERWKPRKVEAFTVDKDGNEVTATDLHTGKPIVDASGVNEPEARADRYDKIHHACEKKRGRGKLFLDQKRNAGA